MATALAKEFERQIDFTLLESRGFQFHEEIGRGAQSIIFRAVREGLSYAVKFQRPEARLGRDQSESALGYIREASTLARMNVPWIPKVFGSGEATGLRYLITEYIEGKTLEAELKLGRMSIQRARAVGISLLRALLELHKRGLVHQDLKPSNILVRADGSLVLIDFGFVQPFEGGASEDSHSHRAVGSVRYSGAPEQTRMIDQPIDGRADLYALGVILFECVTGQVPFQGESVSELVLAHARAAIPEVRSSRPDTPVALAAIIQKLLQKDPLDRYGTALGALRDLEWLEDLEQRLKIGEDLQLGNADDPLLHLSELPLIGRESELRSLTGLWDRVKRGGGAFALVEGEPGMGKTRLLKEVIDHVAGEAGHTLHAKCDRGGGAPFGVIKTLVDRYVAALEALPRNVRAERMSRLKGLSRPARIVLARFSPRMRATLDVEDANLGVGVTQEEYFETVTEVLGGLNFGDSSLLIVVDDLQWADESSLEVLKRFSRRVSQRKILVALAYRADPESQASLTAMSDFLGDLIQIRIRVGAFHAKSLEAFVSRFLGGRNVDSKLIDILWRRTSGSPFVTTQFLRSMLDQGIIEFSWMKWTVDSSGIERMALASDVVHFVLERLHGLPQSTRKLLREAAVIGPSFRIDVLSGLHLSRSADAGTFNHDLSVAIQQGLIERRDAESFAFTHDRIQESLLSEVPPEDLRRIHWKIGELLEKSPARDELIFDLAKHLIEGGVEQDPKWALRVCKEAGNRAAESFADQQALVFLRKAKDLAVRCREPECPLVERRLGEVCGRTGRVDDMFTHYKHALTLTQDPLQRAWVHSALIDAYCVFWAASEAKHHFYSGLELLGVVVPRKSLLILLGALPQLVVVLLRLKFGIPIGVKSSMTPEEAERAQLISTIFHGGLEAIYFAADPIGFAGVVIRRLFHDSGNPLPGNLPTTLAGSSLILANLGKAEAALAVSKKAIRMGEQQGSSNSILGRQVLMGSWGLLFSGRTLEAFAMGLDNFERRGTWLNPGDFINSGADLIWSCLMRGRIAEAKALVKKVLTQLSPSALTSGRIAAISRQRAMLMQIEGNQLLEAKAILKEEYDYAFKYLDRPYRFFMICQYFMWFFYEQGDCEGEVNEVVAAFESRFGGKTARTMPFHAQMGYVLVGYLRAAQHASAREGNRAERRAAFELALKRARKTNASAIFQAHVTVLEAVLLKMDGKYLEAQRLLDEACRQALTCENYWCLFEAGLLKARIYGELQDSIAAEFEANRAIQMARELGWVSRVRRARAVLDQILESLKSKSARTLSAAASTSMTSSWGDGSGGYVSGERVESYLSALIEVSSETAGSLDPQVSVGRVLHKIIALLGAQRGYFFEFDTALGSDEEARLAGGDRLRFSAGIDSEAKVLSEAKGYSRSLLARVLESSLPQLSKPSSDLLVSASESVVLHNIRSAIAAPVKIGQKWIGVVYLDNHAVRGVFSSDHFGVLRALAGQMGFLLEMARASQVEVTRKSMEKDLEVTGAVQSLLIPSQGSRTSRTFELAGFYQAASRAGGDWWWYDEGSDGTLRMILADVTGHGPGPAMVTAALAGAVNALNARRSEFPSGFTAQDFVSQLNRVVLTLCRGEFLVSLVMAEVDFGRNRLALANAGAVRPVIMRGRKTLEKVRDLPGDPLGFESSLIGYREFDFYPEDRVVFATDGVLELLPKEPKGRSRAQEFYDFLPQGDRLSAEGLKGAILDRFLGSETAESLADDVTLLIVDRVASPSS